MTSWRSTSLLLNGVNVSICWNLRFSCLVNMGSKLSLLGMIRMCLPFDFCRVVWNVWGSCFYFWDIRMRWFLEVSLARSRWISSQIMWFFFALQINGPSQPSIVSTSSSQNVSQEEYFERLAVLHDGKIWIYSPWLLLFGAAVAAAEKRQSKSELPFVPSLVRAEVVADRSCWSLSQLIRKRIQLQYWYLLPAVRKCHAGVSCLNAFWNNCALHAVFCVLHEWTELKFASQGGGVGASRFLPRTNKQFCDAISHHHPSQLFNIHKFNSHHHTIVHQSTKETDR